MLSIKQDSVQDQATGLAKAIEDTFEGHKIRIDAQRQMLCASDMCKVNPKKLWKNYYQNRQTKEFIDALKSVAGIPATDLVQSIQGGDPKAQGTWVHIKIAMDLVRWISPPVVALFVYGYIEALESVLGIPRTY